MRISRPCYDKHWRCPGWAGGGWRYARVDRCDGGSLARVINYESRWWRWRAHRCPVCGVLVLPIVIRYVDWSYYGWWWVR
jgi:hypothetical protein